MSSSAFPRRIGHIENASGLFHLEHQCSLILEFLNDPTTEILHGSGTSTPCQSGRIAHIRLDGAMVVAELLSGNRSLSLGIIAPEGATLSSDGLRQHLVDALEAVATATQTLPHQVTWDFGQDDPSWVIALTTIARRHLAPGRVLGSMKPSTPWTRSMFLDDLWDPIRIPEEIVTRFDAVAPATIRILANADPVFEGNIPDGSIRILPVNRFPLGQNPFSPDADPLATLRAVAMATEAGAMEA